MIKAKLSINGVDLSNIVSYDVTPTQIINNSVTTLDGKTHKDSVGWKDIISVQIGDTEKDVIKTLFDSITENPTVIYFSGRTGTERTITCIIENFSPMSKRFWNDRLKYYGSFGIILTEEGVYQL